MTELATDIRTVGELVSVLSKLPPNQKVKVMDGEWGYSHYLTIEAIDGETYLDPRQDSVVNYVWMNGEDTYIHCTINHRRTLCSLDNYRNKFGSTLRTSMFQNEVTCPWCLYNTGQRRTMRNYGGPGVLYGGKT